MDLAFLSGLADGIQTFTHVEAANPAAVALAEGTVAAASDGYCSLLVSGQIPESVPDVPAHPVLAALPVTAALGVGAYCGVPVPLPDGSLYGTLCGLHGAAGVAPTGSQLEAMRTIAGLLGVRLHEEQQQATQRQALSATFLPVLDGRQRSVALQPIVDLGSGDVVGYEALSRFTGRTAGDIDATLVAEGIETAEEMAELVRLGAPMGQGCHLGRPRPPAEILGGDGGVAVPTADIARGEATRR
jgi:GAF domain-containing protein